MLVLVEKEMKADCRNPGCDKGYEFKVNPFWSFYC